MSEVSAFNEYGPLTRVLVKHVRAGGGDQAHVDADWQDLNFTAAPDFARATAQHDQFIALVGSRGAEVMPLPPAAGAGLDSIYVRDASVVTPGGVVLCRMGKRQREPEPAAQGAACGAWDIRVAGAIDPPGRLDQRVQPACVFEDIERDQAERQRRLVALGATRSTSSW